ncbi:hypothetical protein L916_07456 [Plasmopara halstedii]|uniref:EF-hand domain-containing protein n=1 Tax=Plasmopara halstedii TaxID=4781 RepID=A0A0P1B273_PLAHL|nr:hypothetical protein L916_07456 [Plasmopara halstedii]CEG47894.1 hypothetical protein L916_07456 [Plasmopara halstedii]|eukprot:XP_024584263.1 hypothetical protein L916_07456 [Plasmopara halstedii]
MNDTATITRLGKVSATSAASLVDLNHSPRAHVEVSSNLSPTFSRQSKGTKIAMWNKASDGSINLVKNLGRKTHIPDRLHPLDGECSRRYRHPHTQRQLLTSSPRCYDQLSLPSVAPATSEGSDEEIFFLERLNAQLSSSDTVEEWIRSYQLEREKFASFAVFTELKLDEVQETYVKQAGRPSAVEAAACCATLLKMPGIVGCYSTLLEKLSAGIQSAIYIPEPSLTNLTLQGSMASLVQTFYRRIPYFERVRELEKALLTIRSITDPNVLKNVTIEDLDRIFEYTPFAVVLAGLVKMFTTNSDKLGQLIVALQDQKGLLFLSEKENVKIEDTPYPVHVPLATSAQICRAITHNAATFSSSGRDMILCAIVDLLDVTSFRDVYHLFDVHGKMCFLHYLSLVEDMDQLELVVDALPNAGDLAAYLTAAQWSLLSKEFDKHENARIGQKQRQTKVDTNNSDIDGLNDGRSSTALSARGSFDSFRMIMMNFLRHNNLASAQVLQLVADTFLSMLGKREFSQLFDNCWAQLPLDNRWSKALAVVRDLGTSPLAQTADGEHIASMRLEMLKTIFMMLTREERVLWMDQMNTKYPTESYKIKCFKAVDAAAVIKAPDLSDPTALIAQMDTDLKLSWLEALIKDMHGDFERFEKLTMVFSQFANLPHVEPTLASVNDMLDQATPVDEATLLIPPSDDSAIPVMVVVDRVDSPVNESEVPSHQMINTEMSIAINEAIQKLLEHRSESQLLEILQLALSSAKDIKVKADAVEHIVDRQVKLPLVPGLSGKVKRKLSAVAAVAEPMEWHEYVKVGHFDVGCQTISEPEAQDTASPFRDIKSDHNSNGRLISPTKRKTLTLNALFGKNTSRNKKEKYQKINSVAVPQAISGMITSWRMNADQLVQFAKKSLANVLKIIGDAYSEMLTATKRKAQQQRSLYATPRGIGRPLKLAQIVYQSFLHSYGLPSIADMHLLAFSCAIEIYRKQHLRVEYFARFCFEEVPTSELTNYCEFLECIVSDDLSSTTMMANSLPSTPSTNSGNTRGAAQNTLKRSHLVPRVTVPDKEHWSISLDRAVEIAQLCFREMRKTAVTVFCEHLMMMAAQGCSTAVLPLPVAVGQDSLSLNTDQLNVDHLLQLVVAEWQQEQVRRERHLLDAFRAGDVNGDGQLTSAEFSQIVLSIDASRDMGDILLMYSDTLRRTECEQLDAEVFLQVAREHELDRVVWQGDRDLSGVVNNVTDMEATWAHVRGFFVGTLEALARDLPSAHFLRMCEGAGCGCLKCLLDGYVGFQKMRRDAGLTQPQQRHPGFSGRRSTTVGVSSQLIWARFWHLTRQLYDAAAESEGIVTPWEGCKYIRVEPVMALAPRSNSKRRDSLPNFLFPDTARITAKMSTSNNPEVFDGPTIYAQFAYLLENVSTKSADDTSRF